MNIGWNPGLGTSRLVALTNDPQWIYFTTIAGANSVDTDGPYNFRQTITNDALRANPPPAPAV
jgi:hypothetical protein